MEHNGVVLLFFFLFPLLSAQSSSSNPFDKQYSYARFNPTMSAIIVVLSAALFLLGFFFIYVRHCTHAHASAGTLQRALSLRSRRSAVARGLDRSVIETFPIFSYSEVKHHKIGKGDLECAVCLNEFGENETLRLLPKCDHVFHPDCIDAWLESHLTCPVCRANLAPEPGDKPVQAPDLTENDEIALQVDGNHPQGQRNAMNRNSSMELQQGGRRARKFRSHSTGHSVVQPGEDIERFTLRLPEEVRKEALNRTRSSVPALLREGSGLGLGLGIGIGIGRGFSTEAGVKLPSLEAGPGRHA